jgi:hypothetical protein
MPQAIADRTTAEYAPLLFVAKAQIGSTTMKDPRQIALTNPSAPGILERRSANRRLGFIAQQT